MKMVGLPFTLAVGKDNEDDNGPVFGSILDCDDFYVARIWSDQTFAKKKALYLVTAANHFEEVVKIGQRILDAHKVSEVDWEAMHHLEILLARIKEEMEAQ